MLQNSRACAIFFRSGLNRRRLAYPAAEDSESIREQAAAATTKMPEKIFRLVIAPKQC